MERFFNKRTGIALIAVIMVLCMAIVTPNSYAAKKVAVTGVKLNTTSATIDEGKTVTLKATIEPSKATNQEVTYKSSNTKVATVNSSGKVKGVSEGTAKITVTTKDGNKTATCKVTVKAAEKKVTKIELSGSKAIEQGDTVTLKTTITPSNATNKKVTWTSSNAKIATVNNNGTVKGVSAGTATITATAQDGSKVKGTIKVTVKEIAVTKISLNKSSVSLEAGGTVTLKATVFPSNAGNQKVTWSGGTKNITVNNGKVTVSKNAKTGDKATITATSEGNKKMVAKCTVTVKAKDILVNKITLSGTDNRIKVGKTINVKATVEPSNATNKDVTWTTSNANVVTVSNGKVTSKKAGTATITAKAKDKSGVSASFTVLVVQQVTGLKLNKSSISLDAGETGTIKATIQPNNTESTNITWKSSKPKVATVSGNGNSAKIIAMGEGKTTITASMPITLKSSQEITAKCTVEVKKGKVINVKGISIPQTLEIQTGKAKTLTPTITPDNATNKTVTWASSNTQVATVTNGKVNGIKAGTTKITVKTQDGGIKATCTVKVVDPKVVADKVTLQGTKARLGVGSNITVTAELTAGGKKDGVNQKVTWTSSKPNIATVNSNGTVTGIAAGTTKITATAVDGSNKKASFTVTIVQKVKGIEITNTVGQMVVGKTHKLQTKILPEGVETESKKVTYTSSDPTVVSVTSAGKLTALKAGTATITASIKVTEATESTKTKSITVKVIDEVKATSITISPSSLNIKPGETKTLTATIAPKNTTDTIVWKSGNTQIATVTDGVVKGVKEGTVKITAYAKDNKAVKATCSVKVSKTTIYNNMSKSSLQQGKSQSTNSSWRMNCASVSEYYIKKLYGETPKFDPSSNFTSSSGYRVDNPTDLKNAIDNGKLARIHVAGYRSTRNPTGTHWVVVVGYEGDGKDFNDYVFLDSWDGQIYKGANGSTIKGKYNGVWEAKVLN